MEIGVQANLPAGAPARVALPPQAPPCSCLRQQGKGLVPLTAPRVGNSQEATDGQQAVIPQMAFPLVNSAFAKEFYRPNRATMLVFCLPCKRRGLGQGCVGSPSTAQLPSSELGRIQLKHAKEGFSYSSSLLFWKLLPLCPGSGAHGRGKGTCAALLLALWGPGGRRCGHSVVAGFQ